MGYTTEFIGQFSISPALSEEQIQYLKAFALSRRMKRDPELAAIFPDPRRIAVGLPIGDQGQFYVGTAHKDYGQVRDNSIIDYNDAPDDQPGLWCQWIPTDDGTVLKWDGGEKFYNYTEWLQYLVKNILKPWGKTLSGCIEWQGEDPGDTGTITVTNNDISAVFK